jgi:plastocyanin
LTGKKSERRRVYLHTRSGGCIVDAQADVAGPRRHGCRAGCSGLRRRRRQHLLQPEFHPCRRDEHAGGGASTSPQLSADPSGSLAFNKKTLSAKAGSVTITMDNPASIPHGVAVQGNGVNKSGQVVNKGGKSTVTVTLKPGKYTFYCPVPGHRQAGMQGTLTVS